MYIYTHTYIYIYIYIYITLYAFFICKCHKISTQRDINSLESSKR